MRNRGSPVQYQSTRGNAPALDFAGALLAGLAPDGGLYVPDTWPKVTEAEVDAFAGRKYADVATDLMARFTEPAISAGDLGPMVAAAYREFDDPAVAPLRELSPGEWVLELFHGPTLSFKDYALQVVGRLFDHVLSRAGERMTVIGATSGDTGSAAIEAVRGRAAITAFILHPKNRVTEVQRRQMTTVIAPNVHNIAIEGTFDDCQALVKGLFVDATFRDRIRLTAVNSINWARVMAQVVYYFTTAAALGPGRVPDFAVPTGNFGDAFAGHVARQMGLAIPRLVIATNENDILVRLLETGEYRKGPVHATISPSIDIQVSSNFERLLFELEGRDSGKVNSSMAALDADGGFKLDPKVLEKMRGEFRGLAVDEPTTLWCMRDVFLETGSLIDPHTAIGIAAARFHRRPGDPVVYLSTAHPAKFPGAVERATGVHPDLPPRLAGLLDQPEHFDVLPCALDAVQAYIEERTTK
jgi:threonine synthase